MFSYIVAFDTGLAPNPYWNTVTLAVCKGQIRATAHEGDWIVGLAPHGNRLVYTMVVGETLTFGEYYADQRYQDKKPDVWSEDARKWRGDNFYTLTMNGYEQLPSVHSNPDGTQDNERKAIDLRGKFVLTGKEYYYYGINAPILPDTLAFLQVGRGHRSCFTTDQLVTFSRYRDTLQPGVWGYPRDYLKIPAIVDFFHHDASK